MRYMTIAGVLGVLATQAQAESNDIPHDISPGEVGAGLLRMGPNLHGGRF